MPTEGINPWTGNALFPAFPSIKSTPSVFDTDDTKAYSMPLLSQTPAGDILLSWTEKEEQGMTSFCLAFSKDKGKTFSEKKVIYTGSGVGNSRLFRAKVLAKKDGGLIAVFSNRADAPSGNQQGGGREGLNFQSIKNFFIPLPTIAEQKKICDFIAQTTNRFSTAISLKEQEIEKLKEYKATLINSAVTGKIKVS